MQRRKKIATHLVVSKTTVVEKFKSNNQYVKIFDYFAVEYLVRT